MIHSSRLLLGAAALLVASAANAAKPKVQPAPPAPKSCITHLTFDEPVVDFDLVKRMQASNSIHRAADTISFCHGLRGNALDLTDEVVNRIPVILADSMTPDYGSSFSFSVWVQTKPGARQGTPILANKRNYRPHFQVHREYRNICDEEVFPDQSLTPGMILGTTDLGGWYIHLCDSTTWYSYTPTAERQSINDGRWHNIAGSIDLDNGEMWLYFDGENVAIYNMPDLKHVKGQYRTFVGGCDEYMEKAHNYSRGERSAFNGRIDEVKIWDRAVTADEIAAEYAQYFPKEAVEQLPVDRLRAQVWNIWHGGGRFGEHVGLQRVAKVLKDTDADLIGIVETYGNGAVLADSLGFNYYLISDNLSILSRYPIAETIKLYKPQKSGGVKVNLPGGKQVNFFDIWIDWHWETDTIRSNDIKAIAKEIAVYTDDADNVPVIALGDFNSGTHLDTLGYEVYKAKRIDNPAISWPSRVMIDELGFTDSYRQLYPRSDFFPGSTWTPLYNGMRQPKGPTPNRVDYIYYKGANIRPYFSETFQHLGAGWPSDHASVVTDFFLK